MKDCFTNGLPQQQTGPEQPGYAGDQYHDRYLLIVGSFSLVRLI